MKKIYIKKLLTGFLSLMFVGVVNSQTNHQQYDWAISGSFGVQSLTTGGVGKATATPLFSLSGYRYISDLFDARVSLDGFYLQSTQKLAGTNRNFKQITNYGNLHADLMLNLNHFTRKPKPMWNVQPFLGLGFWGGSTECRPSYAISLNGGINASLRFSERVSFFAEGSFVVLPDNCDRYDNGVTYQVPLALSLGVKVYLGKRVDRKKNCSGYSAIKSEIHRDTVFIIQEKIREVRVPVAAPVPVEAPVAQEVSDMVDKQEFISFSVTFAYRSSTVKSSNEAIRDAARFLEENPGASLEVVGYCFSSNKEEGKQLALKRASAVTRILEKQYAIAPTRLNTKVGRMKRGSTQGLGRSVQLIPVMPQ